MCPRHIDVGNLRKTGMSDGLQNARSSHGGVATKVMELDKNYFTSTESHHDSQKYRIWMATTPKNQDPKIKGNHVSKPKKPKSRKGGGQPLWV